MMFPDQAQKLDFHVEKPIGRSYLWRISQKIRRRCHNLDWHVDKAYGWAQSAIETEMHLCATTQRESFLREEIQKIQMNSIADDQKQVHKLTDELVRLDKEYWRFERTLYVAESRGIPGFAKDAYLSAREKAGWHLRSKWLRQDCAKRGGCCGRQCKCCERPPDSDRMKGWGHCTVECACCNRERGFELQDTDRKLFQPGFDVTIHPMPAYSADIFHAYVFAGMT